MPDTPAAEQAATTTTTTTATAATATLPPHVEAAIKNMGFSTIDEAMQAAQTAVHANTEQGRAQIVSWVEANYGPAIAKKMIASKAEDVFKDLNREERRRVRRAVARQDQAFSDDDEAPTPEDATQDRIAEAAASAKEALEMAKQTSKKADVAAKAIELAPILADLARKDPRIAANYRQHMADVVQLVSTGHPKYQGANGVDAASEDTLARWETYGKMAGLERKAAPTPTQSAETITFKQEDIQKSVQEARERNRGSRDGFIDDLMNTQFS